jgi:vacuolar protein sorting-associated protein 13A/C
MESFEISLNSAKDDLPLFTLTMSGSKVNHHSLEDDDVNSEMSLVVGDFRMETTAFGRTLPSYRTILGLAPSASTSLLTVKYSKGASAVRSCDVGGVEKLNCEACANIVLSPMRFVHIHSQVFTLVCPFVESPNSFCSARNLNTVRNLLSLILHSSHIDYCLVF